MDSVIGPSREDSPPHGLDGGGGSHSRNVSGNSQAPLLPPGVTSSPTPPSLTLVNPSGSHTATPMRSSPLKGVVVRAGGMIMSLRRRTSWRELRIGLRGLWHGRVGDSLHFLSLGLGFFFFTLLPLPPPHVFFCQHVFWSAIYCMDNGHCFFL